MIQANASFIQVTYNKTWGHDTKPSCTCNSTQRLSPESCSRPIPSKYSVPAAHDHATPDAGSCAVKLCPRAATLSRRAHHACMHCRQSRRPAQSAPGLCNSAASRAPGAACDMPNTRRRQQNTPPSCQTLGPVRIPSAAPLGTATPGSTRTRSPLATHPASHAARPGSSGQRRWQRSRCRRVPAGALSARRRRWRRPRRRPA